MQTPESPADLGQGPEDVPHGTYEVLTQAGVDRATALREELPSPIGRVWVNLSGPEAHTIQILELGQRLVPSPLARRLDGWTTHAERLAALAEGQDLVPEHGEGFVAGAARADALLAQAKERLEPSEHGLVVAPRDFAPLVVGALLGTPPMDRPRAHAMVPGESRCLPLDAAP